MKRRISLLLASVPLLLSSCSGGFSPYGTYEFRLGKTDGSHLAITVDLSNEDYEAKQGTKKMLLGFDLGSEFSIAKMIDGYEEKYPLFADILERLKDTVKDIKEIEFYYSILDIETKTGKRVAIGSDFLTKIIKDTFPEIAEQIEEYLGSDALDLKPEILRYLFTAYINSKTFTFQLPVSQDEIMMQLAWYGKYVSSDSGITDLDPEKLPGLKGEARFGSHPSVVSDDEDKVVSSEVAEMNKNFEDVFSNTYLYQYDSEKSEEVEIGKFVTKVGEDSKTNLYLYLLDSYKGATTNIKGYIYQKDLLNVYSIKQDLQVSVDSSHKCNVVNNGKADKEEGFIDEAAHEITFTSFMKEPFVFRDFHDVKLGLTKI